MKAYTVLLITIIFGSLLTWSGCSKSSGNDAASVPPVDVSTERITLADGSRALTYSGTIEESESIPLSFSVVGTVARVLVSEGDFVKKGQVLAVLNNETYGNSFAMAHASQTQAEDAYTRLAPMHKNGNLPEIKFVEVETGMQQARAAAAIAKKNLDDCNLRATTDGYIGKRSIDPGMSAVPGFASITIVKIGRVFARVPVPETEIASVKKGAKGTVVIGALGSREYEGTVEEVGVSADPLAHSYKIKIGITNKDGNIKPGMICTAVLRQPSGSEMPIVPQQAVLVDEAGARFVYLIDEAKQTAVRTPVTTGKYVRDGVEITRGVKAHALVVVEGQHKLTDNASVHSLNRP